MAKSLLYTMYERRCLQLRTWAHGGARRPGWCTRTRLVRNRADALWIVTHGYTEATVRFYSPQIWRGQR